MVEAPTDIIGINFGSHDASVALVRDGDVVFAAEEERFNRQKHTKAFPENALHYLLRRFTPGKVGRQVKVAFFMRPWLGALGAVHMAAGSGHLAISALACGYQKFIKRMADWERLSSWSRAHDWPAVAIDHHRAHAA